MSLVVSRPPMGWNTYNTFGGEISEQLVRETVDHMVESGLKEAGYEYVILDDWWSLDKRDSKGQMVPDPIKFPSGLRAMSDYIHSRGLKFGIYSCVGVETCGGAPGSFEHEYEDAQMFAEWGVDYLKYDYCYKPFHVPGHVLYKRMALALRNCGRDILLAACNWGYHDAHTWMRAAGAHTWRSYGDINDGWNSIRETILSQLNRECYGGQGAWNDMDMMVVGMSGKGHVAAGGCTEEEYKTHFSAWALATSPLIIGCDIRQMSEQTRRILMNRELIAINQDPEGRPAYTITYWHDCYIYVKILSNGDLAIGFFNLGDKAGDVSVQFFDIGVPTRGYGLAMTDVWTGEDLGVKRETYRRKVEPHACHVVRARLVKD